MRPLTLDVRVDDGRIKAHTEAGGYVLALPVARRFWRTVDLLDVDLEHRAGAEQLRAGPPGQRARGPH